MATLVKRAIFARDGCAVHDVSCVGQESRSWSPPERSSGFGLVFIQQGAFVRRSNAVEAVMDPAVAYFEKAGQEQQVAHLPGREDRCTALSFTSSFLASMWGGNVDVPETPVFIGPDTMLAHRLLLTRGVEPIEQMVHVVGSVIARIEPTRLTSGRPSTAKARRRIVEGAREALSHDVNLSLIQLAELLAVSPHHLSRLFAQLTGQTLASYRISLRVANALRRVHEGDRNLAWIAAEEGFSDHAHLTRTMRRKLGYTPSALRSVLRDHPSAAPPRLSRKSNQPVGHHLPEARSPQQ
ncbi:MAG TPA: helix-turn-helix transcriptional regulator [Actinomycetota bacterium]|jgi:AraC-like DNA-binding protein|nr:helix-turn-helix transcriptional regulator [Actinomycetota bacterium]